MKRLGSVLLIVPLVASAAATGCQKDQSAPPPSIPAATYDEPVTRTVTDYEEFPGESEAIIAIQVTSRVAGYMTQVYFKDGDLVEEGNMLFQIDPRQYKAELERAEGNLQQIEAHKARLEKEYHRAKNLLARGSISPEEYDRYESDFKETEANMRLAKANRDLAQLNYGWCEVRAGTSGRLSRRLVDPGNLVKADETVLTSIVSLDPIYVYFDVHEQAMLKIQRLLDLGKVKARSRKQVPVEISLSDEGDENFPHKGVVDFTDNKVDINTGTLRFRAKLGNSDHFITPGLFVRVRLPIGEPHSAVMIREKSLVTDQGEKGVFIVRDRDAKGNRFLNDKQEPIQRAFWSKIGSPGVLREGFREIAQGVRPGDWVVVSGMQRLKNGREVKAERYAEVALASPARKDLETDDQHPAADPGPSKPFAIPAPGGAAITNRRGGEQTSPSRPASQ